MANNKRLGKGLGAIFGDDIDSVLEEISKGEATTEGTSTKLNINDIRPNPYQPRTIFNDESLQELANSIKEVGLIQPIIVRKSISGYELLAGERRLRASKLAGNTDISAIIVDVTDKDMMEYALLENIQREDLNIIEEALGYEQLIKKLDYTQEELAKRIGKSRAHITNVLRILKLPQEIIDLLRKDKLTFGHARALVNIEDEEKQLELAKTASAQGLSVRDIERLANLSKSKGIKKEKEVNPYLDDVRRRIESKYSTNVELDKKKIVIKYHGTKDLNRILEIMGCIEEEND